MNEALMQRSATRTMRIQSQPEEMANSVSHGIGFIAALVGTPFLIMQAVKRDDAGVVTAMALFSTSMIILYLASTLYHALPGGKAKRVFRMIEHSAIYLLIAGTYTPFTLGILRGAWGWSLFGAVWTIAAVGIALKVFGLGSHPVVSTSLYLLMGWLVVVAAVPLVAHMPRTGLLLLLAGGLSYTVGVSFFAADSRLKYGHFIWHLFVLAGTVCHYFAVLWYAV
ncbi:hemolysin III family protein [Noviherbaspirillum sp. UKPF54]|uniref:PAQR family membrane homeostasis protein TrhA n=1 Tax=Noviherbaspirillum sp. UKPF54 TaxID=2601898 RepID=UPI001FF01082|nr:hemolysin III family protein [Noviherbaspirillum sp. UKPF54]